MNKLDKTFKINPIYEADSYKMAHHQMMAPGVIYEYWHWTPRKIKYMHPSIKKVLSAGQQLVWRYIHSHFQENFFNMPKKEALKFSEDMSKHLNTDYDGSHFEKLYDLGYLPLKVKALPEGLLTDGNIPHMTGINTHPDFAWLGLFLETMVSKLAWQLPTAGTIAHQFKKNAVEWVTKTNSKDLALVDFMCHDFHSRGGNPFTSIAVGLGHAMSNSGSDTLGVIPASRYYYDEPDDSVVVYSVRASEHSVTTTGIFYYERFLKAGKLDNEIEWYYSFDLPCEGDAKNPDYLAIAECLNLRDWLIKFPTGIMSVVSDTFDLWKLLTYILPRLKSQILARDGKIVIRPDSGDPADILCGVGFKGEDGKYYKYVKVSYISGEGIVEITENEYKGVIELLWETFGGTVSKEGYRVLDSHSSTIYGDAINLDRQLEIYSRLADKGFAATNVVLGIGSFTYVYCTRDTAGLSFHNCESTYTVMYIE